MARAALGSHTPATAPTRIAIRSTTGAFRSSLGRYSVRSITTGPARSLDDPESGATGADFARSISSAGDLNGDGFGDLVVGAPSRNSGTGRVYVYIGGAAGLSAAPIILDGLAGGGEGFGSSVSNAADVDGDGYGDMAVGAPGATSSTGRAYVYFGGGEGLAAAPVSLTGPDGPNGSFGLPVAGGSDLNGDGFGDIVVGATGARSSIGRAHAYFGGPAGISTTPTSLSGVDTSGLFGASVATAGDVNGDGCSDLAIGAPGANRYTGRVHVCLGGVGGVAITPITLESPDGNGGNFGTSLASASDVNADGFDDLSIGAPGANSNAGRVHVYAGGASPLSTFPVNINGPDVGGSFGYSVAAAGDVNGDAIPDLLVGAPGANSGLGRAHVYLGGPGGPRVSFDNPTRGIDFGSSIASTDTTPRGERPKGSVSCGPRCWIQRPQRRFCICYNERS